MEPICFILVVLCLAAAINAQALQGERVKGGCLPYALAYCANHSGSRLILVTWPLLNGNLSCHALVEDHGFISDNMHPERLSARGQDPISWAWQLGYNTRGLHLFREIDFDNRSTEDRYILNVLRKTIP